MDDIKDIFLNDVENHEMQILHDEGVYRHIMFKKPGTGNLSFSLVTWPGYLAMSGDMGEYTFKRLDDMFNFFRTPGEDLEINTSYWCEKLMAVCLFGSIDGRVEQFDAEETWDSIKEVAIETFKNQGYDANDLEGFKEELLDADDQVKAQEIMEQRGIEEAWEYIQFKPTTRIQWALYAIAWGIKKYKNHHKDKNNE